MNEPNYNETVIAGVSWMRCYSIHIFNTYNQTPNMKLYEERITNIGDNEELHKFIGEFNVTFNIEDPRHVELYTLINKIYVEEREKRDLALQSAII